MHEWCARFINFKKILIRDTVFQLSKCTINQRYIDKCLNDKINNEYKNEW